MRWIRAQIETSLYTKNITVEGKKTLRQELKKIKLPVKKVIVTLCRIDSKTLQYTEKIVNHDYKF